MSAHVKCSRCGRFLHLADALAVVHGPSGWVFWCRSEHNCDNASRARLLEDQADAARQEAHRLSETNFDLSERLDNSGGAA